MNAWEDFCKLCSVPPRYQSPEVTSLSDPQAYSMLHEWLRSRQKSVLLMGPPGRGKTYATYYLLKCLLGVYRLEHVRFFRSSDADQRMIEEIREWGSARSFIDKLCEISFLVLDDFGIECNSERMERNYYDLLDKRLAHDKPTIVSTNVHPRDFEKLFGSRIASRLQEYVQVPFCKGDLRTP